jgi:calcineurin-like phosphoesterase family protein
VKIGILNDLHVGHDGPDIVWHNRLLFDLAGAVAESAVAALNREGLDAVFVLGDITQAGLPHQVVLAHRLLSRLTVPWFAVPGNHDRLAVASGQFDRVFAGHTLPLYARMGGLGVLCLRESLDGVDLDADICWLGDAQIAQASAAVRADRPPALLVLCHFPLLEEPGWADGHGGKDAGCLADGARLIDELAPLLERRAVILCGHQHWHHVTRGPGWIQCVTASLIEYPMEMRVVTVEGDAVSGRVLTAGDAETAAASLLEARWVEGRDTDRAFSARLTGSAAA